MVRHKNRTLNGNLKKQQHQDRYNKWWLHKHVDLSPMKVNGKTVKGKIIKVDYIGNSVYGLVEITLDNGVKHFIYSRDSFRPEKSDLEIL